MPRRYATTGEQAATAADTILSLEADTNTKGTIYEILFGSAATPADQAFNLEVKRFTAAGTSTAVTPQALDPDDPAALLSGGTDHSAEPTYTANSELLSFSVNQQATFRWTTLPEQGLVIPATASNGIGMQFVVVSGGTALSEATFHHEE